MMGQRVFMIALMASLCVALPTTDLVVPEAKYAGTSGAEFVQSTLKSGGTEAQCRTFATDTIASINAGVTSEQGILAAVDTGSGCAQEGQSGVATATTNKATADADVVTKTQAVTDATATQATACNAPVTMVVNLPTLTATTCYDYTQEASFQTVQGACDAANTALSQANSALGVAQTAAADAQTALDAAIAEAARLMSACHCRVQNERANAWTAAGTATASHAAEWKQAHEILCALDQTSTCTVPSCPAVTQPAAASGVDAEDCSQHGQHCLRITTGTGSNNDGDLTVEVTAGAVTTTAGNFAKGATVVQHCYSVAPSLQVNDHSNDAWTGSFEYSSDGGSTYSAMTCTNCGVGTSAAMVVFDGNTDGSDFASTKCLNGATCAIQVVERDVRAFCTGNEAFCDDFESYTSTSSLLSVWAVSGGAYQHSDFDFHEGPECYNGGKCLRFNVCNSGGDAFTQQTFSGSRTLTFMSHGAVLYGAADGYPGGHNWPYHPQSSTASQGWTEHTVSSPQYGSNWRMMFETHNNNDCVSYLDNVKLV